MYTRNSRSEQRIRNRTCSPPPGYAGSAFAVKHTSRSADERNVAVERAGKDGTDALTVAENTAKHIQTKESVGHERVLTDDPQRKGTAIADELIGILKGRMGSEEMIILLVILLVCAEGISAEAVILALCLIAG